jgi:hypothetical protein
MPKHGKGPKDVLVRKHARWVKGERKRVGSHKRGADPIPASKLSDLQFAFGFDQPGTAGNPPVTAITGGETRLSRRVSFFKSPHNNGA